MQRKEPLRKTPFTAAEIKTIKLALDLAIKSHEELLDAYRSYYDPRCMSGQMKRKIAPYFKNQAATCKRDIKRFVLIKNKIQNVIES